MNRREISAMLGLSSRYQIQDLRNLSTETTNRRIFISTFPSTFRSNISIMPRVKLFRSVSAKASKIAQCGKQNSMNMAKASHRKLRDAKESANEKRKQLVKRLQNMRQKPETTGSLLCTPDHSFNKTPKYVSVMDSKIAQSGAQNDNNMVKVKPLKNPRKTQNGKNMVKVKYKSQKQLRKPISNSLTPDLT